MKKNLFVAIVCIVFLFIESVSAQKIFIRAVGKVGDNSTLFKGGSLVRDHENEIEATGYSETDSSCGYIAGGGGSCKTAIGPWVFSMSINPSIIDFKSYMYTGKRVGRITVEFETAGGQSFNYYTVVMNNVFIKMVSESAGDKPQFYIEVDPSTIEWSYIEQKSDGTTGKKTSFGWDRSKNTPL